MQTIVLAFVAMLIIVSAMAIGVIFGRRPISGSCGGLANLGLGECEICGGDPGRCKAPTNARVREVRERDAGGWYRAD